VQNAITSNQGSKGLRPWPGVQGARSPRAARRVGEQRYPNTGIEASGFTCRVGEQHLWHEKAAFRPEGG